MYFRQKLSIILIQMDELSPHYQVHLKREDNLDIVELHVEVNEEIYRQINGDMEHAIYFND